MKWRKYICYSLVLIFVLLTIGCGSDSSPSSHVKEVKTNNLQGTWYSTKNDKSSGVVSSIIILDIKDEKTAHLSSWDLKGNTFYGTNGSFTKILWQSTSFDLAVSKSGNTLTFTVPNASEMGNILECKYDESKGQLLSKDGDSVFTKNEISIDKTKDENIKSYQEFAAKQGINAEIEKDMTSSEYMEYVKRNAFSN